MKKILVIRFSSIGDIVLATPVIRCLKQQIKGAEVHFVTKKVFAEILTHNPNIDKLHTFDNDVSELFDQLKAERFDALVDLHKNLRSFRLKKKLGVKSFAFNKLNIQKFMAVRFKTVKNLPPLHIVDRYLETVKPLGVKNDGLGLDYFIPPKDELDVATEYFKGQAVRFIALVVGGSYYTKQIPLAKLIELCESAKLPVVLLGGKSEKTISAALKARCPQVIDTCGQLSINQSASVIRQAGYVITSDTGLMHIAAAFKKKIYSVWGNTVPEFGMGPYLPDPESQIVEVKNLSCRPCSKLGYKKCPKGHFHCMNQNDFSFVTKLR